MIDLIKKKIILNSEISNGAKREQETMNDSISNRFQKIQERELKAEAALNAEYPWLCSTRNHMVCSKETRNLFVEDGLQYMNNNPTVPYTTLKTGDMMISFFRNEDGTIEVNDCKILRTGFTLYDEKK